MAIIFGVYGKRLYLCTRFREARPFGFVRIGSVTIERVHWKSYIKRESSTRAWMVFGEDVVLLRGYPRVKKKRTVMIPVYAGHIRGCEKKREKRVSSGKDILQWRVWSWLRMNASYRLNTCKSRGSMDPALLGLMATGARVSNAYPTCPLLRDSLLKGSLIPDVFVFPHGSDK